jgi:D-alanyl-lipoteichoic acid acyltransferase DltB (MBOAT superfamily)
MQCRRFFAKAKKFVILFIGFSLLRAGCSVLKKMLVPHNFLSPPPANFLAHLLASIGCGLE